jgi:hypothetical protein
MEEFSFDHADDDDAHLRYGHCHRKQFSNRVKEKSRPFHARVAAGHRLYLST